jgi:Xaa-Pro aminopeptidase
MVGRTSVLDQVRLALADLGADALLVPSEDAHQSEYVSDADKRRAFVSGFTGSAGTALITKKEALLWTDGRYLAQAEKELTSDWTLMKQGLAGTPGITEWIRRVREILQCFLIASRT